MAARLVILGNPSSRRVAACCAAAHRRGMASQVVSYLDFLRNRAALEDVLRTGSNLLRIESPSEDLALTRKLLRMGIEPLEAAGGTPWNAAEVAAFRGARGEIAPARQWFLGFRELLRQVEEVLESAPQTGVMTHPATIPFLFDKFYCQSRWKDAGFSVPRFTTDCRSYDQVRALLFDETDKTDLGSPPYAGSRRLFIKLRYGFSAIGAVALERVRDRVRAITATEVESVDGRNRLFLSKRVRVLLDEAQITWLIDRLAVEEIIVEPWLAKAQLGGRSFDLRVVTIGGRARHVVGRASHSPFTNLNLDSLRIDRTQLQQFLGAHWPSAMRTCELAAAQFPKAHYLGIDLLVRPNCREFFLLEANAFGDNLPGLLDEGQETYDAELEAMKWGKPDLEKVA